MAETRTQKSLKNAQVALLFYFIQLILGFFSRKAFFDYLGSEILGLNTTASNLLGFLNLAELGVSAAIGYFLYQPLYERDYEKLNKLVSLQGWIYRNVGIFIIVASCMLMFFFPLIFSKSPLPIWYAYLTFSVLLFSSLLGYFYNYRQIVLYADQKEYVIKEYIQGITIAKTILQIIAMTFLPYPFFSWIIIEVFGTIIITTVLNFIIKKNYPWLKTHISDGKKYLKEYPDVLKKTSQAFFHRIGNVILTQSSPLIIYAFTSLTTVALYGNYILIINKVSSLLGSVFGSTNAAIGNLVASKDKLRIIKVFWELYDSRLYISFVALLCLYYLTNPFIIIWIGKEYCLSRTFLLLYIILNGISMTRTTVDSYINAYGLFNDIWSPIAESILNIGFSIYLGFIYGLNGIIIGIIISQLIIVSIWKPYFLFKNGFMISPKDYFIPIIFKSLVNVILFFIFKFIYANIDFENISKISDFLIVLLIICFTSIVVTFIVYYYLFQGIKDFLFRIQHLIK